MKLNIHYPVLAWGKPERSIKDRMILQTDSADFEVPEYSGRELVRAATFRGRHFNQADAIYALGDALYSRMSSTPVDRDHFGDTSVTFQFGKHRSFPVERPWAAVHVDQYEAIQQIRDQNGTQLSSALSPEDVANVVAGREKSQHRHNVT